LKRAIQSQLENPLAQEILNGRFGPGDEVRVDVKDGKLLFESSSSSKASSQVA
jgi:ATP-dependent Clp protease ATP-binding subunit ClpB